jgi:hypothetical protein
VTSGADPDSREMDMEPQRAEQASQGATGVVLAGRYRLDEPIAAGAVGEVWQGLDAVLERPVAVKLCGPGTPSMPTSWPGSGPRPGMQDRCHIRASRRCMTTASLTRHTRRSWCWN